MKEVMLTLYDGRIYHGTTAAWTFGDGLLRRVSRCIRPGPLTPEVDFTTGRVSKEVNGRRVFRADVVERDVVKMWDDVWLRGPRSRLGRCYGTKRSRNWIRSAESGRRRRPPWLSARLLR